MKVTPNLPLVQYSKKAATGRAYGVVERIKEVSSPVLRSLGESFFTHVMSINNVPSCLGREEIRGFLLSGTVEGSPTNRTPGSESDSESDIDF